MNSKYLGKGLSILPGVSQWGRQMIAIDSDNKRPTICVPRLINDLADHISGYTPILSLLDSGVSISSRKTHATAGQ